MIHPRLAPTDEDRLYDKIAGIVKAQSDDRHWCHVWLLQLISVGEIRHINARNIWREAFGEWETPFG